TNMVPRKVLTKRKLLAQYLLLYPIYTVIALAALCGLLAVAFGWSFSYAKSFFLGFFYFSCHIVLYNEFQNNYSSVISKVNKHLFGMAHNKSINALTSFAGTHTRGAAAPLCRTCLRPLLES
ncbi:hypothetical protein AAUPMB_21272, partial [Pasteurella multocida subsp. multocida str. Anand1_buffalo]